MLNTEMNEQTPAYEPPTLTNDSPAYEPPTLTVIGSIEELTLVETSQEKMSPPQ